VSVRGGRIRIAIASPTCEPDLDDPDALLARYHALTGWARALAATGSGKVDVVQRFDRNLTLRRDGVDYHFVTDGGRAPTSRWFLGLGMVRALRRLQPDLVHVQGLVFPLFVRNLRLGLPSGTAIVAQDHGGIFDGSAGFRSARWRAFHRFGLRATDGFLFTARPLADPWKRSRIFSPDQEVHEVPESSTDLDIKPLAEPAAPALAGHPAILWVGRLDSNKDPLTVLDGFEQAIDALPGAQLTFVYGGNDLLPRVRARIASSPALGGRVHLRGALPRDALPSLYRSADLFVLGSHREGSSFALIEALAFGVAPIVTDIPAFAALTGRGRVGALYTPEDSVSLARALASLGGTDAASRRALVRSYFEQEISWPAVAAKALAAYRAAAATRAPVVGSYL
jgi:glycosyltransferase involved in cell wall biosynthesis